ncbi:MAG: hypothetical protein ACJATI_004687 [Halioglobus sp.]|jgi:hypothetical protein
MLTVIHTFAGMWSDDPEKMNIFVENMNIENQGIGHH